jgi:hypothetical protein
VAGITPDGIGRWLVQLFRGYQQWQLSPVALGRRNCEITVAILPLHLGSLSTVATSKSNILTLSLLWGGGDPHPFNQRPKVKKLSGVENSEKICYFFLESLFSKSLQIFS